MCFDVFQPHSFSDTSVEPSMHTTLSTHTSHPTHPSIHHHHSHRQSQGHWIVDSPISNPMSVYEQYRDSRTSWGIGALGSVIVEVELADGTIGVGISIGGEAACFCVENHLSRFVEGQDPTNVELIYDQMWRSTMNYGRKGLAIQAISAVDLVSSSSHGDGVIWKCTLELTYDFPGYMGRAWKGERCAGIRAPRWQNKALHAVLRHHRAS